MALRDDAPRVLATVVAASSIDAAAAGDQQQAAARHDGFHFHRDGPYALAIGYLAIILAFVISRCLDRGAVTEAWLAAVVYVNLMLVMLSGRRLALSPPGSAAEGRARLAVVLHLLAILVAVSLVLPLFGVIIWVTLAVVLGWYYKMGLFD